MAPLRVGTLTYNYQTIDVIGPLDVLTSSLKEGSDFWKVYMPFDEGLISKMAEFEFHHVGVSREPVALTGGVQIVPTTTVDEAPELDILILGGPVPHLFQLDPRFGEFIRQHVAAGRMLWTNCTGAFVAAAAGALDGRRATINQGCLGWVRHHYPKVQWTGETKWVVDGQIWTAAGAVAGMDMAAHWVKERYGREVMTMATMALDFEPRNQNGVLNVLPKRYEADGTQISTHVFLYHDKY